MICVILYYQKTECAGFSVSGHAGYAEAGQDIVCAGVTSAVQLTFNGITEILGLTPKIKVEENEISLLFEEAVPPQAISFLEAFALHMRLLRDEYSDYIEIVDSEVQSC